MNLTLSTIGASAPVLGETSLGVVTATAATIAGRPRKPLQADGPG